MDDMSSKRGPLGDLIEEVRAVNGWSQQEIADRATRAGYVTSKQNVSRLVTTYPLVGVTRATVLALAAGLGISPDRVAAAAIGALGFRPPAVDITPAEAIARDPSLSADTRNALLAILRSSHSADRRGA